MFRTLEEAKRDAIERITGNGFVLWPKKYVDALMAATGFNTFASETEAGAIKLPSKISNV